MPDLSSVTIKHFNITEDAVVVERYFGSEISKCPKLFDILITDKEDLILARAKVLDAEDKAVAK